MDIDLRDCIVRFLEQGLDLTLATLRPDGWPQATTVSYVSDGLILYFGCGAQSQKAQNLASDDRVSATIDLPYRDWREIRGLSLSGHARALTTPDDATFVGRLFRQKFPQISSHLLQSGEMALFAITPLWISILDYTRGFGHTELVHAGELLTRTETELTASPRPDRPARGRRSNSDRRSVLTGQDAYGPDAAC